jgi:class 3 adenylate cyclase
LIKHLDPILLKDLEYLQIRTLTRKKLTVVFWDISGFSKMCYDRREDPEAVIFFLKLYFSKAIEIIENGHGVLDKFMGDGILAYFGYNSEPENGDPNNAIRAALEFRNIFPSIKEEFDTYLKNYLGKGISHINLKCGMDNGPAYLHYYARRRNSVILMGSTVNLASRLESFAKNNEIIISAGLKNMIQKNFGLTKIMVTERQKEGIKGFKKQKFVYAVNRELPREVELGKISKLHRSS